MSALSNGLRTAVAKTPQRLTLPRGASFWAVAAIAFLGFAANAAASPLYRVYQAEFHFTATTLTLLFTVYIVALLVTLLFLGSISDFVGRRPVILAGLAFGVSACALFLLANGTAQLFAGRALQGVSVGLLGGTSSAALIDMRHASTVAPLVSSAAPTGGQALGAIGASALAQYAPAPTRLVWWIILAALIIASLAVATMRETGPRRPGVLSSFRPHIGVPRAARDTFVVAMPCLLAVWALAGFYLSLGPSLAGLLLHSANLLWGGVLIFLFTGLGAGASAALVRYEPTRVMLGGCILLVLGALVTFASIDIRIPAVLFAGTAVAGLGFGPAFMGAFRSATALAPPGDRASLITSIYVVSYLATGIPAVIGGIATTRFGLDDTALVYSLLVALLAAAAAILLISRPRHAANAVTNTNHPSLLLGPGTVPPCPPSP